MEVRCADVYISLHRRSTHDYATPDPLNQETIMNINLRALVFGAAVAAAMTITIDTVVAAETTRVTAQHAVDEADVVHLEPIMVIAHKSH